jgi:hypothetical protein
MIFKAGAGENQLLELWKVSRAQQILGYQSHNPKVVLNKLVNSNRYMQVKKLDGMIHVLAAAAKNINSATVNKRETPYEKN